MTIVTFKITGFYISHCIIVKKENKKKLDIYIFFTCINKVTLYLVQSDMWQSGVVTIGRSFARQNSLIITDLSKKKKNTVKKKKVNIIF